MLGNLVKGGVSEVLGTLKKARFVAERCRSELSFAVIKTGGATVTTYAGYLEIRQVATSITVEQVVAMLNVGVVVSVVCFICWKTAAAIGAAGHSFADLWKKASLVAGDDPRSSMHRDDT